jgi:hypothetical protein
VDVLRTIGRSWPNIAAAEKMRRSSLRISDSC